jgi:hypothetical protein
MRGALDVFRISIGSNDETELLYPPILHSGELSLHMSSPVYSDIGYVSRLSCYCFLALPYIPSFEAASFLKISEDLSDLCLHCGSTRFNSSNLKVRLAEVA